jgi:hypothetical protein
MRRTNFEGATKWSEASQYCPGTLINFTVQSPDIGGTSTQTMVNDLKGQENTAWISPTQRYGQFSNESLATRLPATASDCGGSQKMAYFYNNVGHRVPGTSDIYFYHFGHVRYTSFAIKLGDGAPGTWGYFESPLHSAQHNTKYVVGQPWCLVAQWRQDSTPNPAPPILALMLVKNTDPNKVTYQVRTYWGTTNNPTVNENARYPFRGTLTKGQWHTFIFETRFGATGTVGGVPSRRGYVRVWVNGVRLSVLSDSGDADPSTTNAWDGYMGFADGITPSAAFLLGPYRNTSQLNQTVFFDKVSILRATDNLTSSTALTAADPANW